MVDLRATELKDRVAEMVEANQRGDVIEALPFLSAMLDIVTEIEKLWLALEMTEPGLWPQSVKAGRER